MRIVLSFSFLLLVLVGSSACQSADSEWLEIGSDLNSRTVEIKGIPFLPARILLVRASLANYRLGVIRAADFGLARSDVKTLAKKSKAVAAINANFFDEKGEALGLVLTNGILRQRAQFGGKLLTGIFQVTQDRVSVVHRGKFSPESVVEAIQAGPRLLIAGSKVEGIGDTSRSRRSGICIDSQGRVIFFTAYSTLLGVTIHQIQDEIASPAIGCIDALNLDGGGSSQLYVDNHQVIGSTGTNDISIVGDDQVPVALGLFVRR